VILRADFGKFEHPTGVDLYVLQTLHQTVHCGLEINLDKFVQSIT